MVTMACAHIVCGPQRAPWNVVHAAPIKGSEAGGAGVESKPWPRTHPVQQARPALRGQRPVTLQ